MSEEKCLSVGVSKDKPVRLLTRYDIAKLAASVDLKYYEIEAARDMMKEGKNG